jgi:formylglycine-generating enzyme required for sulfatase activity
VRLGSPKGELGRQLDEGPQREIPVNAFAIGRFEVTFAEWDACAAARACPYADDYDFGRGRQPVIMVSWDDAQVYLKWLRRRTGQHYRLPTEAEWEWAARAGRSTRYPWGEMFEPARANGGDAPTAVGLHPPNRFGLHDMIGNVREWVHDCRSFSYRNHPGDASPYLEPNCTFRTARGGSWGTDAAGLRVANRSSHCQDNRSTITGFRVARDLDAGLR